MAEDNDTIVEFIVPTISTKYPTYRNKFYKTGKRYND